MVSRLHAMVPDSFEGPDAHGNCVLHIFNLAARAITSPFERGIQETADGADDFVLPNYDRDEDNINEELDNFDVEDTTLLAIDDDGELDEFDLPPLAGLIIEAADVASVLSKVCICYTPVSFCNPLINWLQGTTNFD